MFSAYSFLCFYLFKAKFFVETGIIFVTSLAFLLLIYIPKVMASITDRKNAIAEEKRKAYSSFIENRVKRENEYDDDNCKDGDGSSSSSISSMAGETTDETSNEKVPESGELKRSPANGQQLRASSSRNNMMANQGPSRSKMMIFGGAQKMDKETDTSTGIKIIHNPRVSVEKVLLSFLAHRKWHLPPRMALIVVLPFSLQSERNLNIAQGREMSRKQLAQYCGKESRSDEGHDLDKISSKDEEDEHGAPVEEQSPPSENGEPNNN